MKMKQDRQLKQCGKRIYLLYLILCTLWPWSIMIYLFICGQTMWPRISKALSRSSLVPLLLPEVRESDFEKTSQSLEGCLSLYTNIHIHIHIHASCAQTSGNPLWHPKNPTQNITKDCKNPSFKWLFFLLALALGSLGRGCHTWQIQFSVFNSRKPKLDAHVAKMGLHQYCKWREILSRRTFCILSGVVWIINWELRNTKTTDPDSWCTVVLYHPPDHPNCGPNHWPRRGLGNCLFLTEDTKSGKFHISSRTPSTGERVTDHSDHQTIFLPCRKGLLGFIGLYPAPESWISTGILSGLGYVMKDGSHGQIFIQVLTFRKYGITKSPELTDLQICPPCSPPYDVADTKLPHQIGRQNAFVCRCCCRGGILERLTTPLTPSCMSLSCGGDSVLATHLQENAWKKSTPISTIPILQLG